MVRYSVFFYVRDTSGTERRISYAVNRPASEAIAAAAMCVAQNEADKQSTDEYEKITGDAFLRVEIVPAS